VNCELRTISEPPAHAIAVASELPENVESSTTSSLSVLASLARPIPPPTPPVTTQFATVRLLLTWIAAPVS
jgi:hypothetical protein